jgi:P-type Ca2+ transporter type 2C
MNSQLGNNPRAAPAEDTPWHTLGDADIVRSLRSDSQQGLSDDEVARRLAQHGPNELEAGRRWNAVNS